MNVSVDDKKDESHNITAKELGLKPKTKAFADKLLVDDKISATQAYIDTHKTENRKVASVNSTNLLKKPSVQIYMANHVKKAKRKVIELLDSDKQDIAFKAATDVLDRYYGKAIARTENNNTNLNLNIEASKELADDFTAYLKSKTAT